MSRNLLKNKIPNYIPIVNRLASLFLLLGFIYGSIAIGTNPLRYKKNIPDYTVDKVIDGDTIELTTGDQVRYIGIDTPEIGQPGAQEATNRNRELLKSVDNKIKLERDVLYKDRYDRILGYVWAGDVMVNETLVAEGLANIMFVPPDNLYQLRLNRAYQLALKNGLGLWKKTK